MQLARIFDFSRTTVTSKLKGVRPCGEDPRGNPTYTATVAAIALGVGSNPDPADWQDDEGEIDPDKLPPDMEKDYWDAKNKRQKFEREEGDLWGSIEVLEVIGGILKPLSFAIRSMSDSMERRGGFTPAQIEALQQECDAALLRGHEEVAKYCSGLDEQLGE